jgi:trimeric autotransporter adhesin
MAGTELSLWRRVYRSLRLLCCVVVLLAAAGAAMASEYHGIVSFNGLPVPGVTVTVTQGGKKFVTVTDAQGFYSLPTLADGATSIDLEMTGFSTIKQEVTVAPDGATAKWDLKLMSLEQIRTAVKPVVSAGIAVAATRSEPKKTSDAPKPAADQPPPAPPPDETVQRAADGLVVNGSVNNAATSQFSMAQRFGNTASGKSRYNFSLYLTVGNSALSAKSWSPSGIDTPKPETSQLLGGFAVQGPIKIPHLLRNGPNTFLQYQRTENTTANTMAGLVPDAAVRTGDFSNEKNAQGQPVQLYAPTTGLSPTCIAAGVTPGAPIAGNIIPAPCISSQATALLNLYPLPMPNFTGNPQYNYQVPLVTDTHADLLTSTATKTVGRNNQLYGNFGLTSTRSSSPANLLGYVDATNTLGISTNVNWAHTFNAHTRMQLGYQFSHLSNRLTPFFANRTNVSGDAGITGNLQDPTNLGPPTLGFSNGLTSLTDGVSAFNRNETNGFTSRGTWNHGPHNVSVGFEFRRQEFNYLTQANPRGTFNFTGAASAGSAAGSGSDVADFVLGVPDGSAIAYGNADKYLRQSVYAAYLNDDWRVSPQLTVNVGVRWEYGAPATETQNRLVNLDVAPGFSAIQPVVAVDPVGTLTGQTYPTSLMYPDKNGFEPQVGLSWRPIPGSSMVIKAGYGLRYDTSVYQGIAIQMAQQAPLAVKSFSEENSADCVLTLANGFHQCSTTTPNTFGVDPNFRVGYVSTWNLVMQRDLPGSLQMVATYLGIKGTRGVQEFLPNTNPPGTVNPCTSCPPVGFKYLTSSGNSTRESGSLQLRRRLHSGFTASVVYTYSKSIDDDSALGGQGAATSGSATLAQNWLDLNAERGLSTFDQRNVASIFLQYTTGMGMAGGTLMSGWKGRVYKEWTIQTQINAGSGLPETPINSGEQVGGYTASVRPNVTGAPLYASPPGRFVNPAAFVAAPIGQWGDARRDAIIGPSQFSLNATMLRTFRMTPKLNLDVKVVGTNALNHVTFTNLYTGITSTQFGLPSAANPMRTLQTSITLRY